jgi:hypothetical protein
MVKESDIFGGKQWTREEQFEDEMNALKYQIKYTLHSYGKLKKGEWKQIQEFIEGLKKMKIILLTLLLTLAGCKTYYASNGKAFPRSWGKPPEIQTKDYVPLPNGFGHGSSTLLYWIQVKQRCETPLSR